MAERARWEQVRLAAAEGIESGASDLEVAERFGCRGCRLASRNGSFPGVERLTG